MCEIIIFMFSTKISKLKTEVVIWISCSVVVKILNDNVVCEFKLSCTITLSFLLIPSGKI